MIHIDNAAHGQSIMEATGGDYSRVTMEVISRTEQGPNGSELYGGVVYENYTGKGGSVLVHIAGFVPNWINRDMLFIMFDYPFRQLECKQAFCQVRSKNAHTLEFCKSFGWEEVITLEGVFPDDDMILMRMRKETCRFLNVKPRNINSRRTIENGQAQSAAAARL